MYGSVLQKHGGMEKKIEIQKTEHYLALNCRRRLCVLSFEAMIKYLKISVFISICVAVCTDGVWAQYEDNPLRGKRWWTIAGGINTADYWSWQGMVSYSKRGESSLIQTRVAFTQELWMSADDSCTERRNKLSEFGVLWGDGWGGKRWYATGSVGFGFNVRQFCRKADYENEFVTGITLGVPFQIEAGLRFGKYSGIGLVGVGNWNFREPYLGAHLAYIRYLGK